MIDRLALNNSIRAHEGYSQKVYRDSRDIATVGWGTNVSYIEDSKNHEAWFDRDVDAAILNVTKWLGDVWDSISPARQAVIAEMAYQLGMPRLSLFEKFRAALLRSDYADASLQMRLSHWYEQVPKRAEELVAIMEHG